MAGPVPSLGGTPIYQETDVFTNGPSQVTVHSFVYHGVGSEPPTFTPLAPNETLFAYLVRNTGTIDADIFAVDNPNDISILQVGTNDALPAGWNPALRNDPDFLLGGLDGVQFGWTNNLPIGLQLLHPGEWAVSFYRSFGWWKSVDGFAGNLAQNLWSIQSVPGAAVIPEPASILGLLAGCLMLRRRSRR